VDVGATAEDAGAADVVDVVGEPPFLVQADATTRSTTIDRDAIRYASTDRR
jgi:hypothetical protein